MESVISLPRLLESVKLRGSTKVFCDRIWNGLLVPHCECPSTSSKPLGCGAHRLAGALISALGQERVGMKLCLPEPPSGHLFPLCSSA